MLSPNFFEFNIGHVAELGVFAVAFATLYRDRKKNEVDQLEMHAENRQKLQTLADFHQEQHAINIKRDEQVNELKMQTALLQQSMTISDRRLKLVEDRYFRTKNGESLLT